MEKQTALERFRFSGMGEVYSFTVVTRNAAPAGYERYCPYVVALIELEEGPMVMAMLTDVDRKDVHIGMKVETVIRILCENGEHGLIHYGYKFRPI
ncbi:OB-fold domain-containing protein [Candidatus Curtissbacteria bacterium]|nr:OB-fold domain-containing protein [Candidatus Curtissbacteria bacterium]